MNLYNIPRHWPPRGDEHTGTMTLHGEVSKEFFISLKDLHEPAWWSGVRFVCPSLPGRSKNITFTVDVVNASGEDVSHISPGGSWTQMAGEWHPFKWAIPAALARKYEYQLRVRHDGPAEGQWVTREIAFHELDALNPRDRYIFTSSSGPDINVWYQWNGDTEKINGDIRYVVGDPVHLIPPLIYILNTVEFRT
jgi:hypothetical protein